MPDTTPAETTMEKENPPVIPRESAGADGPEESGGAGETETLKARLKTLEDSLVSAKAENVAAVAAYRAMTVAANRDVPADLITGQTVAEVAASLADARELVAWVKAALETTARLGRVPPGAPGRTGPDIESLSATEKIKLGVRK